MKNIQTIKALVLKNAMFYGETLTDAVIAMHAEALSDLPVDQIATAYSALTRKARVRRMPLPAEVRDLIQPQEDRERDDADASRVVAGKIPAAISKYGSYNSDAAKEYIGELGWEVVQAQGGWQVLCMNTNPEALPILQAQWRELALSLLRRARMGKLNEKPSLPTAIVELIKLPQMPT